METINDVLHDLGGFDCSENDQLGLVTLVDRLGKAIQAELSSVTDRVDTLEIKD